MTEESGMTDRLYERLRVGHGSPCAPVVFHKYHVQVAGTAHVRSQSVVI
jgi:hypothetical protein